VMLALAGFSQQAQADSGSSNATLTLVVPVATSVSCSSSSVTANTPGTQTLTVDCTITGNPNDFSPTGNSFSNPTVTLTSGGNNLTATAASAVTSPNSSVTNISGNTSGFTADLASGFSNTWTIRTTYTVPTTSTTPSGTYTGTTTYTWSFI
jgi:hypothetical protein